MEKKEIRKQIREIKKQYTLEDKKRMSASVWQQVEHNEVFQRARVVLGQDMEKNKVIIKQPNDKVPGSNSCRFLFFNF